jgi:glycine/D-amino acid oxidase-like deaminating enzyme/nitrite reductase/ring-hydroxylating ferredoxin subunit
MKRDSSGTVSIWMDTAEMPEYTPIIKDARCDVVIVGAGIAGLTSAYLLAKTGRKVIVLDDGPVGMGETSRTTAHISPALDDRYQRIEQMFGEDGAKYAAESHLAALNRIEAIVREEGIVCDFTRLDGYLFLGGEDTVEILEQELVATHKAGIVDTTLVARAPLDFWNTGIALRFPRQGQFHPLKYLAGLCACIERDGGLIYTHSKVEEIKAGSPVSIGTSEKAKIKAGAAIIATNSPISDMYLTHARMAPYRSYVVGFSVPSDSIPAGLYWDTPDPYHYIRTQNAGDHDVLIIGGEDHKTGQKHDWAARFQRLEEWTRARFPMAGKIEYEWSGQVMEPVDYLGLNGRDSEAGENIYMITADSGNGMTNATLGAMLLTDLILGRDNAWESLYKPTRVALRAAPEFAKQNVNVALQYAAYVMPAEVDDVDKIQPGTGAVIRRDGHQIAAYRDDKGTVHEHSAVCPHLKCIVDWNSLEKSWDCPCHGSRFDAFGRVLNGPASSDLQPID